MQISSRADLEALRGTPEFATALRNIHGARRSWTNAGTTEAPNWQLIENGSVLTRFGFTAQAFADEIAGYGFGEPTPPEPRPLMPPTLADVERERERRLAAGFSYDFGDARGVHVIGTSEADMIGWSDVTTYAGALMALEDTTTVIDIITNTGPAQVTASEWQQILLAAAAFRQPIWAASFMLQAMDPLPADVADDVYWPPLE